MARTIVHEQKFAYQCSHEGPKRRCYLDEHVLDFSKLGMQFTDIDCLREVNGNFLMIEWKNSMRALTVGQRIVLERLSQQPNWTVLEVVGPARTMEPKVYRVYRRGKAGGWVRTDREGFKSRIKDWDRRCRNAK